MSRKSARLRKNRRVPLSFDSLEQRLPVSEQLGTGLTVAALSSLGAGIAQTMSPPQSNEISSQLAARRQEATNDAVLPPSVTPVGQLAVVGPGVQSKASVSLSESTGATVSVAAEQPLDDLAQEFFDLLGSATGAARRKARLADSTSANVPVPRSGADTGTRPAGPAGALASTAGGYRTAVGIDAYPNGASAVVPSAPLATSANGLGLATDGAAGAPTNLTPGDVSSSGQGGETGGASGPHGRRHDPLWVLDANNALVLNNGATYHDFSTYTVDLYAQVSGATVSATQPYMWDLSQAPDATAISGQTSYHLHFTWATFTDVDRQDQIKLTVNTNNPQPDVQTFKFKVVAKDSPPANPHPAWAPQQLVNWATAPSPDVMTARQATVDSQYYSLGLATGELKTSHTLPRYNPLVDPLRLVYSSTAADGLPIFIDHYTLASTAPSVAAQLTVTTPSGPVSGPVTTYDTSVANPLNAGDIMEIALQATSAQVNVPPGRYPYSITVTANGTPTTVNGSVNLVSSSASINNILGKGWSIAGLERLYPQGAGGSNGAILDLGAGLSLWFAPNGSGGFNTPAGDSSTLQYVAAQNLYVRTLKNNTKINFDASSGRQTSVVERHGNALTYHYDGSGKLTSISDLHGQSMTLTYNASNEVASIQDPANRVTTLGYDKSANLISITDPTPAPDVPSPVMGYGYDAASHITSLTDPDGHATTFAFDSTSGRLTTVNQADKQTAYLSAVQPQGVAAANSQIPAVLAAQAVADYFDPRGNQWQTELDWLGFGLATEASDPITDANGNLLDTTVTHRDANGLRWLVDDPLARRIRYFFDNKFNPTKVVLPDDKTEQFSYDSTFSELTQATDPNNNTTTFTLDPTNGNVLTVTNPPVPFFGGQGASSDICTFTYTGTGKAQMGSSCDGNGNTVTFGYDAFDRRTSEISPTYYAGPSNPTVTFTYNAASDLTSRQDENGFTTVYAPDNLGRVTSITYPTNPTGTITMTYDPASNRVTVKDAAPVPNVTTFNYDPLNRVSTTQDQASFTSTYVYDPSGNLQDQYDRNGRHRHFDYDPADRRLDEQWLSGATLLRTFTYVYDAASQLTQAQDADSSYVYGYDVRGRVISVDNNGSRVPHMTLTYGYDATGNRTSMSDSLGGTASYMYDAENRLGDLSLTVSTKQASVTLMYDLGGRLRIIERTTPNLSGSAEIDSQVTYNARDLIKTITHSVVGGATLSNFSYGYDAATHLTSSTGPEGSVAYTPDPIGELTAVTGARTENYQYDRNGNRTSANGSTYGAPGPDNELTFDGTYTYTYDHEGNLLSKVGNGVTTTFTWDYRNRLTEARRSDGADDQFTYDVNNLRIGKHTVDGTQLWTAYDAGNPYADFNVSGALTNRYLYGLALDQLFARMDNSGNVTWYLGDNLGSIRQLANTSGQVTDNITYGNSYGNAPVDNPSGSGDRFKFIGREYDVEVGLYSYRNRYYDPAIGRFLSQDPLMFRGGDSNLYRYVMNRPTQSLDPTGLLPPFFLDNPPPGPTFPFNPTAPEPTYPLPTPRPFDPGFLFDPPPPNPDVQNLFNANYSPTEAGLRVRCGFWSIGLYFDKPDFGPRPPGPVTDVPPDDGYHNPRPLQILGLPVPSVGVDITITR
jgi:RHS repeat-associated protein